MVTMLILLFISIAIPVCIGLYVYYDAKDHGMEALLWAALAVLVPYFIGLIVYLVVRYNRGTHRCYRCGSSVKDSYTVCPQCGIELKSKCPNCGEYIEPSWHLCAHCGTELPYIEPYHGYPAPGTSGFNTQLLLKGLLIAAIITIVLALLFALATGFFISIPFQLHGMSFMHHI